MKAYRAACAVACALLVFGVRWGADAAIYRAAFDALVQERNIYEARGFYYLPHFFIFICVFQVQYVCFVLGCASTIILRKIYHCSYLVCAGCIICAIPGNFDWIACLAVAEWRRGRGKAAWATMMVKPQLIVLWLVERGHTALPALILGAGVGACVLGVLSPLTYVSSFVRPSVLLFVEGK